MCNRCLQFGDLAKYCKDCVESIRNEEEEERTTGAKGHIVTTATKTPRLDIRKYTMKFDVNTPHAET